MLLQGLEKVSLSLFSRLLSVVTSLIAAVYSGEGDLLFAVPYKQRIIRVTSSLGKVTLSLFSRLLSVVTSLIAAVYSGEGDLLFALPYKQRIIRVTSSLGKVTLSLFSRLLSVFYCCSIFRGGRFAFCSTL